MQHGVFYLNEGPENGEADMKLLASYAYRERKDMANRFKAGEGLIGQCALEKERIFLTDVPPGYIQINSGLGEAAPLNIVVLPVLFEGQTKAVIELASFQRFSDIHLTFFDQLTESIGIVLNTIAATMIRRAASAFVEHRFTAPSGFCLRGPLVNARRGIGAATGAAPANAAARGVPRHVQKHN